MSVMSGFVSDEQDAKFKETFSESETSTQFMQQFLKNDGDRMFFGYSNDGNFWIEMRNKGGRLHVEVGEPGV